MIKKTVTYTDYNGNERTEDFYFNLSKAELTEMEYEQEGGLQVMLEKIVKERDNTKIMKIFKDIVLRSYGEKSADGKRFIKNDELREAFSQTEAYSEIFIELASNAEAASNFINGVVPKQLQDHKPKSNPNHKQGDQTNSAS